MEIGRRPPVQVPRYPCLNEKSPRPGNRDGDCALLLLDLNQQPFD